MATRIRTLWVAIPLMLVVVVVALVGGGALLGWAPGCRALRFVSIDGAVGGCRALAEADAALAEGRRKVEERQLRAARELFRAAALRVPSLADAHLERGRAAEALGDYDEALAAYREAFARRASRDARLQLASMTARVGDFENAVTILEGESGVAPRDVWAAVQGAGSTIVACGARVWPAVGQIAVECVPFAFRAARAVYRGARDAGAQFAFEILLDAGQRGRALTLARRRGWVRGDLEYCGGVTWELGLSEQTVGFLAMLLQPDRADCLLAVGYQLNTDGLVRLARTALRDRAERSGDAGVRQRAARYLRFRLPAHEVVKVAESLNVTAWRLQNRLQDRAGAVEVYQRAIAADPAFSWPYHNLGRLYHAEKKDEDALVWLRRTLTVNPNDIRALRSIGAAASALERWDEAAGAYQRAIALDPDDADSYADLGRLLLKLGREAEGMRAMQMAVRIDPRRRERAFVDERTGGGAPAGPTPFGLR
jgi:tetratricopeptide (TPR) repeat protein